MVSESRFKWVFCNVDVRLLFPIQWSCHNCLVYHYISTNNLTTHPLLLKTFHQVSTKDYLTSHQIHTALSKQQQEALSNSGYDYKLGYETMNKDSNDGKRRRKIIWFNPPYSMSVATNIGKCFLKLVNSVFYKHVLNKIFNANILKVSYSCMPNISSIIKGHNEKILNKNLKQSTTNAKECNC